MNKMTIYIAIGAAIGIGIVHLFTRRWRIERERIDRECDEQIKEMAKSMAEEDLRHKEAMKQIQEEGERIRREMDEKVKRELEEMATRFTKMADELNIKPAPVRYRDAAGAIHELDITDKEAMRKVISDRTNRLIF